ncbi:thioredoxin domain-containing protein [Luteolibacter arcticus]|uniref:Thioredoxin domain-containing protein n=1 Tax=Luteolibacter arcticus TaxID=1581411 RepID=A0ABT3GQT8_9BACT|nr:vitamin K epoxide reductase family protein [Luteolibacter arcticus]MCW1925850.1 thioredoxin domain-containing protein [Luteolibacter arcticus]
MKAGWLFVACGVAIHALLVFVKSSQGIAGCGSACDEVLSSRWSFVAGVPVPWFGIAAYLLTGVALRWRKPLLLATCLVLLGGAVVWFLVVQAFVLHRFCGWCLTAHVVALATITWGWRELKGMASFTWSLAVVGGVAPIAAVILIQVFGPVAATHRIEAAAPFSTAASQLHAQGGGRKVDFDGGMKRYDVEALPRLGSADAKHVLVEYFDYQCPACRTMHGFLEALRLRHPKDIAVIVLPVPLERSCNRLLGPKDTAHPGSCELSRAALAVWRSAPAAFEEVHRSIFTDPQAGLRLAREKASTTSEDDAWINEMLKVNAEDWIVFSSSTKHLPKLLIRDRRILHGLPSSEADFLRVMQQELGL